MQGHWNSLPRPFLTPVHQPILLRAKLQIISLSRRAILLETLHHTHIQAQQYGENWHPIHAP